MIDNTIEKKTTHGGARAGAGRKRTLPEGSKPTTFVLTQEERLAVRKFIVEMRKNGQKELDKEREAQKLMDEAIRPLAEILHEIIKIYGGRGKGFRRAEEISKIVGIIAFKDSVGMWEKDNPRIYEQESTFRSTTRL